MGTPSIADAAVRGGRTVPISPEQAALTAGDVDELIAIKRSIFGGYTMIEDDGSDDDGDDDTDDGDDGDDDGDDEDDDGSDARDEEIKTLKAENKRRRLKAREQDQKIRDLEKQIQGLAKGKGKKDGDDGDADDSSERVTELEQDREALLGSNADLRIENAFLKSNKYAWKNPSTALRLLDRSEIDLGDDGEVEGLEEALDALAKSDPYLLAEQKDDDDDDEDDEKPKPRKRTGQPVQKKRTNKGQPNRDALLAKYPALRR
jgi:hypothetical protein